MIYFIQISRFKPAERDILEIYDLQLLVAVMAITPESSTSTLEPQFVYMMMMMMMMML